MCGLVGVMSSNMMMKHKKALHDMLYLDTWRGRDATGVAALRHSADTAIMKATIPGYEFVEGPKLEEFLKLNDFLWIGHNRFGTMGKNIKTNAHPFQILDDDGCCLIVGAHNGTLKNKHVLKDHAQFGTDSEALFNNIADEGIENTIPKIEGAWALTYYDHVEEEFRIIRNKERTLFYAFEEGKKSFIWASEQWMIRVACSRHEIKLEQDKVFTFNEDTLYRIPVPLKINEVLELHRKGGLEGKAPAFFQGGFWRGNQWHDRQEESGGPNSRGPASSTSSQAQQTKAEATQTASPPLKIPASQSGTAEPNSGKTPTPSSTDSSAGQSESKAGITIDKSKLDNITPIDKNDPRTYKGYSGRMHTKKEIEDQLKDGCGWCEKEEIKLDDKGYGWLAPGKPICKKCLDGEHEDHDMIQSIFDGIPGTRVVN